MSGLQITFGYKNTYVKKQCDTKDTNGITKFNNTGKHEEKNV